jgi:hypothetical protein
MKGQFHPALPKVSGKRLTDFSHLPETPPSSPISPITILELRASGARVEMEPPTGQLRLGSAPA